MSVSDMPRDAQDRTLRSPRTSALLRRSCRILVAVYIWTPTATLQTNHTEILRAARTQKEVTGSKTGRGLIVTSKSSPGLAHHSVLAGDSICVFKEVQSPYIPQQDNSRGSILTFVCDPWICGMMNMEVFSLISPARTFTV